MVERAERRKNTFATLIAEHKWDEIRARVGKMQSADIAELLMRLEKRDRVLLFRALPRDISADAFSELTHDDAQAFLHELSDEETRGLLAELEPDDRAELLGELPGVVVQRLLNLLDPKDREKTQVILGYPEESIGRLMTPGYVALRPEWTAGEALAHIRKRDPKSETVSVLYVTDDKWHLVGVLKLRKLIFAEPDTVIETIMNTSVIKGNANDDREKAVELMSRYDLAALPVVDSANVLVGIVTFDDVMDVAQEETTEDIYRSAGVESLEVNLNKASVRLLYSSRVGWLVVLIFVNLMAGAIIVHFEETISHALVLVSFLPLLIAGAGNAGSQAATLAVRSLATGEVKMKDWFQLTAKELAVAAALGVTMGFVVWFLGIWRAGPEIAVVVTLTMILVVVIGSLVGLSLPFLLHKLKLDPAVASSPLIATVSDVIGVFIYLSIASILLA
ncbi:magnesium transporter [Candidatus Parcubacteria bacterium]|nr:MAG: magnesium transporter [Candidatus Parcubacteria bacterium]